MSCLSDPEHGLNRLKARYRDRLEPNTDSKSRFARPGCRKTIRSSALLKFDVEPGLRQTQCGWVWLKGSGKNEDALPSAYTSHSAGPQRVVPVAVTRRPPGANAHVFLMTPATTRVPVNPAGPWTRGLLGELRTGRNPRGNVSRYVRNTGLKLCYISFLSWCMQNGVIQSDICRRSKKAVHVLRFHAASGPVSARPFP